MSEDFNTLLMAFEKYRDQMKLIEDENERLKEEINRLQWELDKQKAWAEQMHSRMEYG